MWCDALGAEHPLVTTSKTVKLPPPVRGNTAVQKRARKSPFARDGRSASLEPLSERNDNPGEEVPAKGSINQTRSTQSLRLRELAQHADCSLRRLALRCSYLSLAPERSTASSVCYG